MLRKAWLLVRSDKISSILKEGNTSVTQYYSPGHLTQIYKSGKVTQIGVTESSRKLYDDAISLGGIPKVIQQTVFN